MLIKDSVIYLDTAGGTVSLQSFGSDGNASSGSSGIRIWNFSRIPCKKESE